MFGASLETLVLFENVFVDPWPVYSLECSQLLFVYSVLDVRL